MNFGNTNPSLCVCVCVWPFLTHFHFNLLHFAQLELQNIKASLSPKWNSKANQRFAKMNLCASIIKHSKGFSWFAVCVFIINVDLKCRRNFSVSIFIADAQNKREDSVKCAKYSFWLRVFFSSVLAWIEIDSRCFSIRNFFWFFLFIENNAKIKMNEKWG